MALTAEQMRAEQEELAKVGPRVRLLYRALTDEDTIYDNAKARYEALRKRLIDELGYDAFFELQHEAHAVLGRLVSL